MPDIYAHSVFALRMMETMSDQFKKMIESNLDAYKWGAMGPDPFYYYGQLIPKRNSQLVRRIGGLLHTTHIETFFLQLFKTLKESESDCVKSYLLGYLSHYYLDKTCHPFIFYRSGFGTTKDDMFFYSSMHKNYEMGLDAQLLYELEQDRFSRYRLYKNIPLSIDLEAVYAYMSSVVSELFDINISQGDVRSAFKQNHHVIKLFANYRPLFMSLTHILPYKTKLTLSSVLPIYRVEHDYLNLSHATFKDPCTGIESNCDFLELMRAAQKAMQRLVDAIDLNSVEALIAIVGCESFETGHHSNMKMIYHNSIL